MHPTVIVISMICLILLIIHRYRCKRTDASSDNILHDLLQNHDKYIVVTYLTNAFKDKFVPKELIALLDSYVESPGYNTAMALIEYEPELMNVFELAREGGTLNLMRRANQ